MKKHFLILAVIAIAGCASFSQSQFLVLTPSPQTVFADGQTLVHMDIRNTNIRTIKNVDVGIFDAGILSPIGDGSICTKHYDTLYSDQFDTFFCRLHAPDVLTDTRTTVSAKATFSSELNAVQLLDMLSEQEYGNRIVTGSLEQKPSSYIYTDGNIQLEIEFDEPLPIVIRDKPRFMKFTISNIGPGFVSDFTDQDIIITQDGMAVECPTIKPGFKMAPIDRKFPTTSCILNMPENTEILQNYAVNIKLLYDYEIRASVGIDIVK